MLLITTSISFLLVGIALGFFALPPIVKLIKKKRKLTGGKALSLVQKARQDEIRRLRNCKEFKNRLDSILKIIEEDSLKNKREVNIAFISNHLGDEEIKKELEHRDFECYETSDNLLRIRW
jgi:hypothetical protein